MQVAALNQAHASCVSLFVLYDPNRHRSACCVNVWRHCREQLNGGGQTHEKFRQTSLAESRIGERDVPGLYGSSIQTLHPTLRTRLFFWLSAFLSRDAAPPKKITTLFRLRTSAEALK